MSERPRIAVLRAMREVFSRPAYVAAAAAVSFFSFFLALWVTNLELLELVLFTDTFDLGSRLRILLSSFGGISTNFHAFSRLVTVAVVVLLGIDVAMVAYYVRRRYAVDRASGAGVLGAVLGMLGLGCASCGSVLLVSLLGTAAIGYLPLRGVEFGLAGIALLGLSVVLVSRRIVGPATCKRG